MQLNILNIFKKDGIMKDVVVIKKKYLVIQNIEAN